MAIGERFTSMMQRPGQDPNAKDDVSWWMKYAGRGLGTIGGLIAIFLGVWNCAFILLGSIMCFISGIWQMVVGFIVVMIEAPCCCLFIDFVQNLSDFVEKKPYWMRGLAYCLMALPSILLCSGINSIIGSGLIFATGGVYGLMSIGKKGALGQRSAAMETQAPSSSMQSTLVENAQPMDYSSKPDSNV
ncbi:hypothetical protein KPH14_009954 [Odynerus spinipes]|uniref:Calcium channel flower n=1 Tax=Odynerus spinipes TaxID=1348599 RepID=A0AAD9RSX8_9HYME|nr:hypothetical protein KPH14_009954 [Odynerus spinipes]